LVDTAFEKKRKGERKRKKARKYAHNPKKKRKSWPSQISVPAKKGGKRKGRASHRNLGQPLGGKGERK